MAKQKGRSSEEKGVYIPIKDREPYDSENIKLSKKEFVEKQRRKKEMALKVKEYSDKLKKGDIDITPSEVTTEEPVVKLRGRPKKIEE